MPDGTTVSYAISHGRTKARGRHHTGTKPGTRQRNAGCRDIRIEAGRNRGCPSRNGFSSPPSTGAKHLAARQRSIRLKDLKIYECEGNYSENPDHCTYPCQSTMKYEDDQMEIVYTAVLDCDVLFLATPIRWNNHSALVQKFVERMNCIENQSSWFGKRMISKKVVGLIIIGHVDGMQHVAGNLLNFFAWLGFHSPEVSIASWVGENDEDTTKDWNLIQKNPYTQEDLVDMVHSSLRLACSLKNSPD